MMTPTKLDRTGSIVSFACAIHCAALPLCVTFLPMLGLSFMADRWFEVLMLLASGLMATASGCFGYEVHKKLWVPMLFQASVALLIVGVAMHSHHDHDHEHGWELRDFLMPAGGIVLCFTHILNTKLCRSCKGCHHGGTNGHTAEEEHREEVAG
jgi:hypothetical protein